MHVDLSRVHGGACSVSLPADAPVRRLSPRSSRSLCPGTLNLQLATAGEPAPATAQLLGPGTAGSIASGHDPSPPPQNACCRIVRKNRGEDAVREDETTVSAITGPHQPLIVEQFVIFFTSLRRRARCASRFLPQHGVGARVSARANRNKGTAKQHQPTGQHRQFCCQLGVAAVCSSRH